MSWSGYSFALLALVLTSACNAGMIQENGLQATVTDPTGGGGGGTTSGGGGGVEPPNAVALVRGMWVWNTPDVLGTNAAGMLATVQQANVTDLYMDVGYDDYAGEQTDLRAFNQAANAMGIKVWTLDGARTYFSDAKGPNEFYEGVNNLVAFNAAAQPNERFVGLVSDNEPNDSGGYTTFHDGLTDAQLSTQAGSGVWQSTQALDREMLMRDWVTIHQTAAATLHAVGLRFAATMPSWTSAYEGAPINVNFPDAQSPRACVTNVMLTVVDDYLVMSYNTSPAEAAARTVVQAQAASAMQTPTPRVMAAVEITAGVGANISYADTKGKDSRAVVLGDMNTISSTLSVNTAFAGMAIEQWRGWEVMPP